jgi:hypothetical protein
MNKKIIRRTALLVCAFAAISLFLFRPATAAEANGTEGDDFYTYQGKRIALEIEPTQVAVLVPSTTESWTAADKAASIAYVAAQVSALGFSAADATAHPIKGWLTLNAKTAIERAGGDTSGTEAIRALIKSIARNPAIEFVSPVAKDRSGNPIIITPSILMEFRKGVSADVADGILASTGTLLMTPRISAVGPVTVQFDLRDGFAVLAAANSLSAKPEVLYAEPDLIVTSRAGFTPNDPLFAQSWHLRNTGQSGGLTGFDMDADIAWDVTTGAGSVIVVVFDNGIQQNHPDINQIAGRDFTSDASSNPNGGPFGTYDNHGTAVAGCVSGIVNNALGGVGVAPGVKVASARFSTGTNSAGQGTFQYSWLVNALNWAQTIGARVTNNSNGFGPSSSIDSAYANTRSAGLVHFASAGNDGISTIGYPSSSAAVNSVAAANRFGGRSSFSQYGTGLDFIAPGEQIVTTDRTGSAGYASGDYTPADGTSFASPNAAAVAALVVSQNPGFTAAQVEARLQTTAVDLGTVGYDTGYGWGFVNAQRALNGGGGTLANDQCSGAIALSAGVTRTDSTASATSTADPIPTCQPNFGKGVWYTFTPATSGTVTVGTCGSNFDTVLQVYTGSCGALAAVSGGCNDDNGPECTGTPASVSFSGTAGTTYRILAGGYNSTDGTLQIVARVTGANYTINLSASPSAGGTVTGAGTYASGSSRTVTATANSGYSFSNWTESGNIVSTSASYTFTLTANRTLVANFTPNPVNYTINVSASPSAGGTVTGGGTYASGTSRTVTATPNSGYSFTSWTESGNVVSTSASYTFTLTANRTLVANFTQNPVNYTINVSASPSAGGTVTGGGTYASGTSRTVTATPNSGYSFTSWTESGNVVSTSASYTFTLTANRTLVANFTQNPVNYTINVSASPSAGGTVTGGGTYASGTSRTVTATPNSGYSFTSWTESGNVVSTSASYTFTLTAHRTLVANFTTVAYTINTSSSPTAGGTTSGGGTYPIGSSRTVTATPNGGYSFVNWTEHGSVVSTSSSYNFTLNSNRDLVANFATATYTISVSASPSAGGTVTGGGTYASGTSRTVTATANSGYTFSNWTESGTAVSSTASYTFTLTANRTLVANFETVNLPTVQTNPATSVTRSSVVVNGLVLSNGGAAVDGYYFSYWTGSGTPVGVDPTQIAISGSSFSVRLQNLVPNTRYHYRAYAHNSSAVNAGWGTGWGAGSIGTFTTAPFTKPDFNGDQKADLIWENRSTGQRTLWLMGGPARVADAWLPTIPVGWQIAATADFNGDGQTDLVWQNTTTGQRAIWLMNGANWAAEAWLPTVEVAWQIAAAGDFNADGHADLVWQNAATGQRTIWLMNGTTWVAQAWLPTIETPWHISVTGDFNSDGQTDLVWQNMVTGQRVVWLMNGTTHIGSAWLPTVEVAWQIAGAADFNLDGQRDLLWQNTSTGQRVIWLMNGTSRSGEVWLPTVELAWQIAETGDFDSDGQADVVWQNTTTGQRVIWLMSAAVWAGEAWLPSVEVAWHTAGGGDFNGDGHVDIVWENLTTGQRAIWLMSGASYVTTAWLPTIDVAWRIAGAADFDGDGHCDLIWQNTSTGQRVIWSMNGLTHVSSTWLPTVEVAWQITSAADFNGDGHADILWRNSATGQSTIWLMNRTSRVGDVWLPMVETVWQIAGSGDFNGDGKPDISWQNTATGQRVIWLMNGTARRADAWLPTIPTEWKISNR